jgi:alkylated DNA nucleotide flippase Atl1
MHMLEDVIVSISPEREKFFGCAGRMLLPCPATVAAVVKELPHGRIATLEVLRQELARRAHVEVACPFQTKQALVAVASQAGTVPVWRLVKKNGELLKYLPGGAGKQAALLQGEKVETENTASGPRVKSVKEYLAGFQNKAVKAPKAPASARRPKAEA